jgi:hypothetical protein
MNKKITSFRGIHLGLCLFLTILLFFSTKDIQAKPTNGPIIVTAPIITSFSPASGPIGMSVIITGTNFNATA